MAPGTAVREEPAGGHAGPQCRLRGHGRAVGEPAYAVRSKVLPRHWLPHLLVHGRPVIPSRPSRPASLTSASLRRAFHGAPLAAIDASGLILRLRRRITPNAARGASVRPVVRQVASRRPVLGHGGARLAFLPGISAGDP